MNWFVNLIHRFTNYMTKRKLKDYYKRWIQRGMQTKGLCGFLKDEEEFKLIKPTRSDLLDLQNQGLNYTYWGSNSDWSCSYDFTELRQNLVLLLINIKEK